MRLSIIVPAFNEGERIASVLDALANDLSPLRDGWEVIVVDDGSSDDTSMKASRNQVQLVRHELNRGKAAAVQTGLAHSVGTSVAVLDADMEYRSSDLLPLLELAGPSGLKAVYGSRYLEQKNFRKGVAGRLRILEGQEITSWVANWVLTGLVFVLYRRLLTDTLTGLKIYPGVFLRGQTLTSAGFEGDHEITCKLLNAAVPIVEGPAEYFPRSRSEGKKIGPKDGIRAVITFVRGRFK